MAVDKLQYGIGNAASSTLGSSMTNADTSTPALAASTNFQAAPTPGEGMVILDEGAQTEELAYATGISGGSLTTPLANRGLEGGSAQGHSANASIKGILTVGMWNNLITALINVVSKSTGLLDTTKVMDLTTAQAGTNKTFTDSTNNIMAKSLKSATTTVDVSAATAPSTGQVLTSTDSTHATWQTPTTGGFASGCSVYNSANVTLNSGRVATKITFNTEDYDLGNEFDTSTNTFTAGTTGKYLVTFTGYIVTLPDTKLIDMMIYKNGSVVRKNTYQAGGGADLVPSVTAILALSATDTVTFFAAQNDVSNQTLNGGDSTRTFAMIQRLY